VKGGGVVHLLNQKPTGVVLLELALPGREGVEDIREGRPGRLCGGLPDRGEEEERE